MKSHIHKLFQNSYETKICVFSTVSAKCEPRLVRDGSAGGWGPAAAAMQIPANYCNTGPLPGHCISRSRRGRSYLGRAHEFHYYYFTENYSRKIIFHTRGPLNCRETQCPLVSSVAYLYPSPGCRKWRPGSWAGVVTWIMRCSTPRNS